MLAERFHELTAKLVGLLIAGRMAEDEIEQFIGRFALAVLAPDDRNAGERLERFRQEAGLGTEPQSVQQNFMRVV